MTTLHVWRKSSYSATSNDCVELAGTLNVVRDSKNPTGRVLPVADLAASLSDIKSGRFDR